MLRHALTRLVSFAALVVFSTAATHAATTTELDAEKIKAGLHTTYLEEEGFVDRALELVEKGKLSASTVYSTFVWARSHSVHRFQHFKQGLLERAPSESFCRELLYGPPAPPPPPALTLKRRVLDGILSVLSILPPVRRLLR